MNSGEKVRCIYLHTRNELLLVISMMPLYQENYLKRKPNMLKMGFEYLKLEMLKKNV